MPPSINFIASQTTKTRIFIILLKKKKKKNLKQEYLFSTPLLQILRPTAHQIRLHGQAQ